MRRCLADGRGAGHHRVRVDQVGRLVGRAAHFATVAVLVFRAALRALALDEAVRQEHFLDRVIRLLDVARVDQPGIAQRRVHRLAQDPVFFRIGRIIVVERNAKAVEIALVFLPHAVDQLFRCDAFQFRAQHDCRAVRIVGAHVVDLMPVHAQRANPDVRLDIFDQVANVDLSVRVRQRGRDENLAAGRLRACGEIGGGC